MCGIVGVIGKSPIFSTAFEALKSLEYRGYDSFGFAALKPEGIAVIKRVGAVSETSDHAFDALKSAQTVIGHTRWATHGKVSERNSHPHTSSDGHVSIVHNGVIANYAKLIAANPEWVLSSETDTEAAANVIAQELVRANGDLVQALAAAISRLEGEFAICGVVKGRPHSIFAIKRKSPLALGKAGENILFSSDRTAFAEFSETFDVMQLEDETIVVADGDTVGLFKASEKGAVPLGISFSKETLKKHKDSLGNYPHYMIKEINESGSAVRNVQQEVDAKKEVITKAIDSHNVYITGSGSAYYVGMMAQYIFHDLANKYIASHPSDEIINLKKFAPSDLLICVSQSGETFDTLEVVKYAMEEGARVLAINNVKESTMQRIADYQIFQNSGKEVCVLSTKSVISQVTSLYILALNCGKNNGVLDPSLFQQHMSTLSLLPAALENLIANLSGKIQAMAQKHCNIEHWFFIGRGVHYPVALENALKFKEVSYLHAEAMPAGFFKHGTISLIDNHFYTVVFLPSAESNHELFQATIDNVHEIKTRGGNIIGVGNAIPQKLADDLFIDYLELPDLNNQLNVLLQLVVGQLLAYYCGVALNRNIDRPRALAKSVTVR